MQISFPDVGSKSDIVKLRGPKEDVDKCAKHFVKVLLLSSPSSSPSTYLFPPHFLLSRQVVKELQENGHQTKVPIFKQFHKFVIGKGGANIRRIRDETDTRSEMEQIF